jgi:signal peptidase I
LEATNTQLMQRRRAGRLALFLALVAVAVQFVRSSFGTFAIVEGSSMAPTFNPSDVVLARTADADRKRGEVVIVTDENGDRVIKRIVGLPGETVALYRGFVYINHRRLREPYLPKRTYTYKRNQEDERLIAWKLGEQEYFVLGDNRMESCDSRHFGPIDRGRIQSIVALPENSVAPEFSGVVLSDTGKGLVAKYISH